jgi:hypothetical protein
MVSNTTQTHRRRRIRQRTQGTARKKAEARGSTPAFPVHPAGYNPKAPDARKRTA